MATAKKLPSGKWRALVYSHTDSNGKRKYESFTASTKKEAEYLAAEFTLNKEKQTNIDKSIILRDAISQYTALKHNVLSPSTIREYERMRCGYFDDLINRPLSKISNKDLQRWVNNFASSHSPKTTRNAYGLLCAVFNLFKYKNTTTDITLPQATKPELYTPSDADIKTLLNKVKGTYMESAIYLAAFGPMRRGEICPLKLSDIDGNCIHITKSMVKGPDNQWHIKPPKTHAGYRTIEFPSFIIEIIKSNTKTELLIPITPDTLTKRFIDLVKTTNTPHFRFHDLRHYGASILHAMGIKDQYIIERGGWSTDNVMKRVYRSTITEESKRSNDKINTYLEMMQHEMQHKK